MWAARGLDFVWLRVPVSEIILNVLPMKLCKGRTGGGCGAWRGPSWGCARGRRSLWKRGSSGRGAGGPKGEVQVRNLEQEDLRI